MSDIGVLSERLSTPSYVEGLLPVQNGADVLRGGRQTFQGQAYAGNARHTLHRPAGAGPPYPCAHGRQRNASAARRMLSHTPTKARRTSWKWKCFPASAHHKRTRAGRRLRHAAGKRRVPGVCKPGALRGFQAAGLRRAAQKKPPLSHEKRHRRRRRHNGRYRVCMGERPFARGHAGFCAGRGPCGHRQRRYRVRPGDEPRARRQACKGVCIMNLKEISRPPRRKSPPPSVTASPLSRWRARSSPTACPTPTTLPLRPRWSSILRAEGAVPATMAIIDGVLKVGLTQDELEADVQRRRRGQGIPARPSHHGGRKSARARRQWPPR